MTEGIVICRLCLEAVPMGYTVFKDNIQSIIKLLTSLDMIVDDKFPKFACAKCIFNLYFIENVKNIIIKSDEKLRDLINRDGNFNELLPRSVVQPKENNFNKTEDEEDFSIGQNNVEPAIEPQVEVKEEESNSPNSSIELHDTASSPEPCEEDTSNFSEAGTHEKNCIVDVLDENDIRKIICKKNNTKPYLYHCNVCNVDFQGHALYMKHKGKHLKKTCEICGVTTRQDNFNKHMTKHSSGTQICDICGSIHKSYEGLRTHLFHFHNAKKKPYICGECGMSFKYSHRLSYHKRKVHTGFRPHQCDTCGKKFFDLGTLKKHVKLIHLKLREHHCKYCQKDYSSQYALKVHTRQHTDETPYVCEICAEGFRQLVSLKTHMAKHKRASNIKNDPENREGEKEIYEAEMGKIGLLD